MPKKTYYKPNRSKPRYFKTCDVARAGYNCYKDTGEEPNVIVKCVAKTLGFKFIALPGKERQLPEKVKSKLDSIDTIAIKLQGFIGLIDSALENVSGAIDKSLSFIPESFLDDEVTTIEKGIFRALKRFKPSRRLLALVKLLDKIRDKLHEFEHNLKALVIDIGEVRNLLKASESLFGAEFSDLSKKIVGCNCKRMVGQFNAILEFQGFSIEKGSLYVLFDATVTHAGVVYKENQAFLGQAGDGNHSDYFEITSDDLLFLSDNYTREQAQQLFQTGITHGLIFQVD